MIMGYLSVCATNIMRHGDAKALAECITRITTAHGSTDYQTVNRLPQLAASLQLPGGCITRVQGQQLQPCQV